MLDELKKVKKDFVKSNADGSEEPKRLKEDFHVIRNKEEFNRSQFKKQFEVAQKNSELNKSKNSFLVFICKLFGGFRSLIPNTDMLEQRARQIRSLKKGRIDRLLRSVKEVAYFKRLFPLVKEEKPGKDLYARITFWQFVIAIYIINLYQYIDARGT